MDQKSLVVDGLPQNAHIENVLIIEQFLTDNYCLRRNVLNGKVEYIKAGESPDSYRALTQEALNSIIIRAIYAQVLYELRELKTPYWFSNEEVARIQQLNLGFMQKKDLTEMVVTCFRKPEEGETVKSLNTTEMLEVIKSEYPNVVVTTKAKAELGRALTSLGFERKDHSHVAYYKAVPLKAAA